MTEQNTQCARLARHAPQVKKNRDFIAGEAAVKAAGELYMPFPSVGMKASDQGYKNFVRRTAMFPAAARVLDGCLSLVFQKDPVLVSPTIAPIKDAITYDMESLELFAEQLVSETLISNYTGILIDAPSDDERPAGLNGANAIELGYHPFLALYPFEAVLDHKFGKVGGGHGWVYVKLSDGENKWRELRLVNGIYSMTVHEREDSSSDYQTRTITPKRDGKPLDFIPFKLVTTKKKDRWPSKALLDDVVNVNCHHYVLSGDHSAALFHCSGPQKVVVNPAPQIDQDGNPLSSNVYPAGPDKVWELHDSDEHKADVRFLEFTGAGVAEIRNEKTEFKSQMSALGSRILQDEKAAPEAAEALAIRQTSQNAAIVTVTASVAKQLEEVLRWLAYWMGAASKADPETRFMLNVDLVPAKLTPQEVAEIRNLVAAGMMSEEHAFYALRDGGWFADTLTWDEHKAKLEAQVIDRPLVLPTQAPADGAE